MVNYNLAASNNVTLEQALSTSQLANGTDGMLKKVLTVAERLDRSVQIFFDAQASTRSRKIEKTTWGFEKNAGF